MKFIKLVPLAFFAYVLFLLLTSPTGACTKKNYIHDTTITKDTTILKDTLIKKDTVTRKDTVVKTDTVYDIKNGLVAYYNFTGGDLHDSSGLHNDIFFSNATPTTDRFGRSNNAYLFNGAGSYMQVHNSPSLNPNKITIVSIVQVNGFFPNNCHVNNILEKGSPNSINGFYSMRFQPLNNDCVNPADMAHEVFFGVLGDDNPVGTAPGSGSDSSFVQTGRWYTLAFTFDGNTAKFYINGVLKDERLVTGSFNPNTQDVFIGKTPDPSYNYFFNGVIDEIRIYNRPLGAVAIQQFNNLKQ